MSEHHTPLTVAALREALAAMPDDLLVLTYGYETGFSPVIRLELAHVVANTQAHEWDGEYERATRPTAPTEDTSVTGRAVVLHPLWQGEPLR